MHRAPYGAWRAEAVHITHSYAGTTIGNFRYLLFVLYKDYIDFELDYVRSLNIQLERLARDVGDRAAVVRPFVGDIEQTRSHVLAKSWSPRELDEVTQTPAMLIISKDFDDFDPRTDSWVLFHFGPATTGFVAGRVELAMTLEALAGALRRDDSSEDELFDIAREFTHAQHGEEAKVFHAQPGAFGFSIDLLAAGQRFRDWLADRRTPGS